MKKAFMLSLLFTLIGANILAQGFQVEGVVTSSEDNSPLPGVTILVKGTTIGVSTDINGRYTINVPDANSLLMFSYIGYLTDEVTVGVRTEINVQLTPDVLTLDELIVVGYGVQRKSLVTGAISQVTASDFERSTVTRLEQAIQGRTPGVYVAQNSGEPGGGLSIQIRGISSDGTNNPIYIVDGIRTGGLEYLNPADIESIEILKDAASSAIYGAEGGNGVVLVTTKRGKKGEGNIRYSYSQGFQEVTRLPRIMNAMEYKEYFLEAIEHEGSNPALFADLNVENGTNWLDEIFQVAPMVEHQLSFSGGSEKSTYYLSLGMLDQDGIVGGSKNNMSRYSFRSNVETEVNDWFSVGVNAFYSTTTRHPLHSTDQYGGIVTTALRYDPTLPVYYEQDSEVPAIYRSEEDYKALVKNEEGRPYTISTLTGGEMWNPVARIAYTERTQNQDKILGSFETNLYPVKWARLTTRLFVDYAYQTNREFFGRTQYGVSDKVPHDSLTSAVEAWDKWYKYGLENFLTFEHQFGDHYIQAMVGMSYEDYKHTWQSARGYSIPYGDIYYAYPSLGLDRERMQVSSYVDYNNQGIELKSSYFGRAMYNYQEKYILQGSIRRDGISKFGPGKKFGVFPAFSVGWNLHREDFFSDIGALNPISSFKLRYSWGKNGSAQNLGYFPYLTTLDNVDYVDGTLDGNLLPGSVPGTPGNQALLWETNVQSNIGADIGLLNNALGITIDWFKRVTTDQLADKSDQPIYTGLSGVARVNDGEIINKGWEFSVSYRGNVSDFRYNVGLNASYIHNEVTYFGVEGGKEGSNIGQLGNVSKYETGEPVWYFYGYEALGIFQDQDEIDNYISEETGSPIQSGAVPGDVKWADHNGNGRIDPEDRVKLGKPLPDWYFGLNLGFEFKGFDLNAFFHGVTGNQIFWASYRNDNLRTNRVSVWHEDRWTGEGTSNTIPRATLNDRNRNFQISSLNVFDGDYLRLKNLSVGYTIPPSLTTRVGVKSLRIYYTGTNLLTFTNYPGVDPEVGNSHDASSYLGIDVGMYPTTKIHSFGVVVNL